jgi:hypothetical protein
LEISLENPNSNEAKSTLKLIDSLLKISGSQVSGSPAERKLAIGTIISMMQFLVVEVSSLNSNQVIHEIW